MKRQKGRYKLKSRLLLGAAALLLGICVLFGFSFFCGVSVMQEETRLAVESSLALYANRLEDEFRKIDLGLLEYVGYAQDVNTIKRDQRDTTDWGIAVYHVQNRFRYSLSAYPADNFFLYVPDTGLFLTPVAYDQETREAVCQSLDQGAWGSPQAQGKWIALSAGEGRLYRAIRIFGCYIGAWIQADVFLNALCGDAGGSYYLMDAQGKLLGDTLTMNIAAFDSPDEGAAVLTHRGSQDQTVIARQMNFSELYLITLIPETAKTQSVYQYSRIATVVLLLMLSLLGVFIANMRRGIISPMERLTQAIRRVRRGNWDTAVDDASRCEEIHELVEAFNKMVNEIQDLKINRYEQQISWQKTEMEYLKQQITPHFMINCLNTIYQLSDSERPELAKRMAQEMSRHIRYTLSCGDTISLAAEAEHVQNYVMLSNIRYHNAIVLDMHIDPELSQCKVVPLILLNFVENTVKYEVRINHQIEIHIEANAVRCGDEEQLAIRIYDTGTGFSREMLDLTADMEAYVKDSKGRIGICNLYKRIQYHLGWCQLRFCNRPGAGAQIDLLLPKTLC